MLILDGRLPILDCVIVLPLRDDRRDWRDGRLHTRGVIWYKTRVESSISAPAWRIFSMLWRNVTAENTNERVITKIHSIDPSWILLRSCTQVFQADRAGFKSLNTSSRPTNCMSMCIMCLSENCSIASRPAFLNSHESWSQYCWKFQLVGWLGRRTNLHGGFELKSLKHVKSMQKACRKHAAMMALLASMQKARSPCLMLLHPPHFSFHLVSHFYLTISKSIAITDE